MPGSIGGRAGGSDPYPGKCQNCKFSLEYWYGSPGTLENHKTTQSFKVSGHHQPTSESVSDGLMVACIENYGPQPRPPPPPPLTKHSESAHSWLLGLL